VKPKVEKEGNRKLVREKCASKRKSLVASPTMQFCVGRIFNDATSQDIDGCNVFHPNIPNNPNSR